MSFLLRQSLVMASFPEVVLRVHVIHGLLPDAHVNCDEWLMMTHVSHLRHWLWLMSELIVKCAAYFPLSVFFFTSLLFTSQVFLCPLVSILVFLTSPASLSYLSFHLLTFSSHSPVFILALLFSVFQSSTLLFFLSFTSLVSYFSDSVY